MNDFKLDLTIAERFVIKHVIKKEILQYERIIRQFKDSPEHIDLEHHKSLIRKMKTILEKVENVSKEQNGTLVNSIGRFENFQYSACMNESETEISFQLSTDKWRKLEDSDVWTELVAHISEINKP